MLLSFHCCCFFCVAILFYCHWSFPQISFDMLPTIMVTHSFSRASIEILFVVFFMCVRFAFSADVCMSMRCKCGAFIRSFVSFFFHSFYGCSSFLVHTHTQIDHIYNLVHVHIMYKSSLMLVLFDRCRKKMCRKKTARMPNGKYTQSNNHYHQQNCKVKE